MKEIPLTQGKTALVSDEDYPRVSIFRWQAVRDKNTWYARRVVTCGGKRVQIWLHRVILGVSLGTEVDHRNRNGLDCQRSNLRWGTHAQNQQNSLRAIPHKTSRFRGVAWAANCQKWRAATCTQGKHISLGVFTDEAAAARAFDAYAAKHYGAWARFNFPEEQARKRANQQE